MKKLLYCLVLFTISFANGQNMPATELPYRQMPAYPASFTAATTTARMIDGLGFRYYWATEGLRPDDLAFRPNAEARSSMETLIHIHGLAQMIYSTALQQVHQRDTTLQALSFLATRRQTLLLLKDASEALKAASDASLEAYPIQFPQTEVPFWHLLNGPLADALWHVGQVVSFRRSSGNPFNGNVNVFMGTVKE